MINSHRDRKVSRKRSVEFGLNDLLEPIKLDSKSIVWLSVGRQASNIVLYKPWLSINIVDKFDNFPEE